MMRISCYPRVLLVNKRFFQLKKHFNIIFLCVGISQYIYKRICCIKHQLWMTKKRKKFIQFEDEIGLILIFIIIAPQWIFFSFSRMSYSSICLSSSYDIIDFKAFPLLFRWRKWEKNVVYLLLLLLLLDADAAHACIYSNFYACMCTSLTPNDNKITWR